VKVYTTGEKPELVATIPTGELPHGIWPSGDGTHIYVALENGTGMNIINTVTNKVEARITGGQPSQALVYVPNRCQLERDWITSNRWQRQVCLRISS
jgi:YVTN family beta-propeller protein